MKVYGVAAQAHSVEETFKNFESENLSIMMKKKWINMLMGMCAAVLLLSLGGCGKEDILDERTEDAAEEDAAVVNMASVTFNLQMEGTSRATYDLSGFDVYAYVYQDKKAAFDDWSDEEYEYYKAEKIEGNKYETELPENKKGILGGITERYRYRIVFLAAPKGSTVLNGSVRDDYNEAIRKYRPKFVWVEDVKNFFDEDEVVYKFDEDLIDEMYEPSGYQRTEEFDFKTKKLTILERPQGLYRLKKAYELPDGKADVVSGEENNAKF